jgi:hypothetical protein
LCRKDSGGKVGFYLYATKRKWWCEDSATTNGACSRDGTVGSLAFISSYNDDHQHDDCDNDDVMISAATSSKRDASTSSRDKKADVERHEEPAASRVKGVKVGHKRKQNGDVTEMMGRYLELKTKKTEEEVVDLKRARANTEAADFSIKKCNALMATMEELWCEERVERYDVFKDIQHREIFMTGDPSSRSMWLKKKIVSDN